MRYLVSACLALAVCAEDVEGSKVETWRQEGSGGFAKAHKEGVVVSDSGRVRLSRRVRATEKIDAARVWDLASTADGTIYAATGDEGKVFKRSGGKGAWEVVYDSEDSQVFTLAVLPDGRVFGGTGPNGSVVDLTDPKHPASRPDPAVKYVWGLTSDKEGNLFAATGPTGKLWKRSAKSGEWSLMLEAKHPHLLCVAVAPDGAVFAGSDREGILYRVGPDGKVSVVLDAPQAEIRSLLFAPDGSLYTGTASESSSGGGRPGLTSIIAESPPSTSSLTCGEVETTTHDNVIDLDTPESKPSPGGTAVPKPATPGENVVYRIDADGVPREVFRARVLIYALAWQDDRLLVGTGPEGVLFEVRDEGRESSPIARLDHGQILALMAVPKGKGDVLIGAGDPGGVLALSAGYTASGTITSEVHNAKLLSRFGAMTWRADRPTGTAVAVQLRTGNVGEPDSTWSSWSPEQTDPESAKCQSPPGRFSQYRVKLAANDRGESPELRSISVRYQTANLPPEVGKIEVPDLTEGDGATRQTRLTLKWDVTDPNGDDLSYTLHIRKEGWPDWVRLGDGPLTEKSYNWDTTAVPVGTYRVKVTASDRPSNDPAQALARDRESESFVIDHEPPIVTVAVRGKAATVSLKDDLTRLAKAAYALDGGDWQPVFPGDGIFDSTREDLSIDLSGLKPGVHVLMVRASDAAGNTGTGDAVFKAP